LTSPKLSDIAAEAGVSAAAVSYVLTGRGNKVAPATREKVVRCAERLGYTPNSSARAMRSGRHGAATLVMSAEASRSLVTPELLCGIVSTLTREGMRMLVDYIPDATLTSEEAFPRILRERACDGMLLNYQTQIPPMLETLAERFKIPAVWINSKRKFHSVYPDDYGAGRDAARALLKAGHTRIAYADSAFNFSERAGITHFSKTERRAGCADAVAAAGLKCEMLLDDPDAPGPDAYMAMLRRVFARRRPAPPSAVVSYGGWSLDWLTLVRAETGAALEILAFGINAGALANRNVRGLVVPFAQVGERAAAMLASRIRDPETKIKSEPVPFEPFGM